MLIVISPEEIIVNEGEIINQLLSNGLELYHLRKPISVKLEYEEFIKTIPSKNKRSIVLHQHHELALRYNVKGLHLKENHRNSLSKQEIKDLKKNLQNRNMILSSSFHSLEEIKTYDGLFDYVFLSPVFESISKPGYVSGSKFRVQGSEVRKTKIIALGGIQESTVAKAKDLGFDGIAVLGAIWQEPSQAFSRFEAIKREYEASFKNSTIL